MKMVSLGVGYKVRLALAVAAVSLSASSHAMATNLFWSGNGTTQGGAGTWNTTTGRFATAAAGNPAGTYNVIWNNANVDSAEFGGTSGQVNIAGPIVVNTIQTDINGFNIGNANAAGSANTITFSGTGAGINVVNAGTTTTISAVLGANTTLVKSGAGRLEMGNANNPNTVKYVLNGGALTTASIARLSTNAPGALVQDFMTFNGGGWAINTGNQDTGANRGITIKSGGAYFGSSTLTNAGNITISSPIVGTEGGGIFIVGNSGPLQQNASSTTAGAVLILNNTANSWDGEATINGPSGSKIITAQSNVIPDTAVINILAAGNVFDMGTNNTTETVKSISGTAGTVAVGTGSLTIADGASKTYSSVFTGAAGGKITKNGSGTWTLSGGSTGWQGEFVMNNGTLGVGGANIFGNQGTAKVTINGGILSNTGSGGRTIPAAVPVALNGDFTVDESLAGGTGGQILFNGAATINGGNRTITVNGTNTSGNLAFGGAIGQDVAGRGIIKKGNGGLTLTAVNTYSGTTQIDAGQINLNGTSTLGDGTGTVVLNGGTLNETASRSGAGSIVANNVQVIANSSITSTSTAGTPIFEFSGALTGTAGKTLTFQDNATNATQFKPRFTGNFTMDSDISLLTGTGAGLATVQLESFNPSGTTQTFTGTISGTGGTFNRSVSTGTGGDTIFTGANTFSGGTTLNSGRIGFGSSSTATTGPIGTGGLTVISANSAVYASGGARTVSNAVTLNSGTELTGSNDLEMSGTVALGTANRSLNVTNTASTILSGVISSGAGGGITKTGAGILTLTGANTYGTTGVTGTTVSQGKLLVNNTSGSGTGAGDVLVNGGILGGTGHIDGSVSVTSGSLSPGASINHLDIGGNLALSGGSYDYEINSTAVTADLTTVVGNLSLASVALSPSDLTPGILLVMGTKFTLINYGGTWDGGIFTGLPNYSTSLVIGSNRFAIQYNDTTGGTNFGGGTYGGGVGPHFVTITAVPEASTFLTIGLGGIFAIAAVWMSKRAGINILKA